MTASFKERIKTSNKTPKRQKEVRKKISLFDKFHDYSSVSTIHGLRYVSDRKHSACGRAFWIVSLGIALASTSFQVVNIWNEWFDDPVVTSLNTISLPVEKIEFPAVTLCPQGSTADIMDNFLFHQFEEWLINETNSDTTKFARNKREVEMIDCECKIPSTGNMTIEALQCCFKQFLHEIYPGLESDSPTKIATMLYADNPDKEIETKAVVIDEEEPTCDEKEHLDFLNSVNQKLNRICPEPFQTLNDTTCIMASVGEMTYNEALMYCREHDGADVYFFESFGDSKTLEKIIGKQHGK